MKKEICLNDVTVAGKIVTPITFDHEYKKNKYYKFFVSIKRRSGTFDTIPVILSKKMYDEVDIYEGSYVYIKGQYISHREKDTKKLLLYVYANEIQINTIEYYTNEILLSGYVAEKGENRRTPFGKTIMDIKLLVHRENDKTSYIPCIIWNLKESEAEHINIEQKISLNGRIQSREYIKKYEDGNEEKKVAYEVSTLEYFEV